MHSVWDLADEAIVEHWGQCLYFFRSCAERARVHSGMTVQVTGAHPLPCAYSLYTKS